MPAAATPRPMRGLRILSLALNLPGPAALMRCRAMGARCTKVEPPAGDPMAHYEPAAYAALHSAIAVQHLDLKQPGGRNALEKLLARTDVLLTSFRPSALNKLGLHWPALRRRHPLLAMVCIVGAPGTRAEEPGHDLTYLAEQGLVTGLTLPATLYADMAGSLAASEAVLQAALLRQRLGRGVRLEVALSDAAAYLALPRHWGLTQPHGDVGGAHALYQIYACRDGRVAVAALEPHFAQRLCAAAGLGELSERALRSNTTRQVLKEFFLSKTRRQLERLAQIQDLPLHTLPSAAADADSLEKTNILTRRP